MACAIKKFSLKPLMILFLSIYFVILGLHNAGLTDVATYIFYGFVCWTFFSRKTTFYFDDFVSALFLVQMAHITITKIWRYGPDKLITKNSGIIRRVLKLWSPAGSTAIVEDVIYLGRTSIFAFFLIGGVSTLITTIPFDSSLSRPHIQVD